MAEKSIASTIQDEHDRRVDVFGMHTAGVSKRSRWSRLESRCTRDNQRWSGDVLFDWVTIGGVTPDIFLPCVLARLSPDS